MMMVGKLAYSLLRLVATYAIIKSIRYLGIKLDVFLRQRVYYDVGNLIGILGQVKGVHFLEYRFMVLIIHLELGDEFLDGLDGCSLVGTGHEGVLFFLFEILFPQTQLLLVPLGVLCESGHFSLAPLVALHSY